MMGPTKVSYQVLFDAYISPGFCLVLSKIGDIKLKCQLILWQ